MRVALVNDFELTSRIQHELKTAMQHSYSSSFNCLYNSLSFHTSTQLHTIKSYKKKDCYMQILVRFYADYQIKPHVPPFV